MRIGILGAGSIGCYVGGRLAALGHDVQMLGRQALVDEVQQSGMTITDCDGYVKKLGSTEIRVTTSPVDLKGVHVLLVSVKSDDTTKAAREIKPFIASGVVIISLQNGVGNAEALRAVFPGAHVLAAMVPFNVLRKKDATFHRATSGGLVIESTGDVEGDKGEMVKLLTAAGIPTTTSKNITGVLWGKLLINLNNAINALCGLPTKSMLEQRAFRRIMADVMDEAYGVMRAAGIKPIGMVKAPQWLIIQVLRLPDSLFFNLAKTMLKVDPEARSSMWQDLDRRRTTEIDHLSGEIVRLAEKTGKEAPLNKRLVALVRQAEKTAKGSPGFDAVTLTRLLKD